MVQSDDIIATLCKEYQDQKTMIISGDKDFHTTTKV